ncbi:MAG: hypothetical protein E4H36_02115 [Spirochaetales bacterium]|nr:MAG: hypothetical protein E4H36_02115 [Spirochaetales bacterium]
MKALPGSVFLFLMLSLFPAPACTEDRPPFPALPGGTSLELRTAVEDFSSLKTRLLWRRNHFKVFALDIRSFGKAPYTMGGIITPTVSAGPLALGGLLKELNSPGGYKAFSSVYSEAFLIKVDPAVAVLPLKGFVVAAASVPISLFFAVQDGGNTLTGLSSSSRIGDALSLQACLTWAVQKTPGLPADCWTLEGPWSELPDFALLHWAVSAKFGREPFYLGTAFCSSRSRTEPSGYYVRFLAGVKTDPLAAELVLSAADAAYLPPLETSCGAGITAGSRIIFNPLPRITARAGYGLTLPEPPAVPELYRESSETFDASLDLGFPGDTVFFTSAYARRLDYNVLGEGELRQSLRCGITLKGKAGFISLEVLAVPGQAEGAAEHTLSLKSGLENEYLAARFTASLALTEELLFSGDLRITRKNSVPGRNTAAFFGLKLAEAPVSGSAAAENDIYSGTHASFFEFLRNHLHLTFGFSSLLQNQ